MHRAFDGLCASDGIRFFISLHSCKSKKCLQEVLCILSQDYVHVDTEYKFLNYNIILARLHNTHSTELNKFLCNSVVEHCVSSAKGCGFDSQETHILMKMYNLTVIVSRFG